MKVLHTLICFFLSALQDSKTRLAGAEVVWTGTEGGAITVTCSFSLSGKKRLFCKEKCGEGDVLIETEDDIKKSGRYIIRYEEGFYPVSSTLVHVTIKQLTMSDSGSYECGLKRSLGKDGYEQIRINVRGATATLKPTRTVRPSSATVPAASAATTQSSCSSAGSSTPSSAGNESTKQPETSPAGPDLLLYVSLTLVFMIIVLLVALLVFCRNGASKPREFPESLAEDEESRTYEEIREERGGSRSPPDQVSTVYSLAQHAKPNAVETTDCYSLVTAPCSQKEAEEDSSALTYSEVNTHKGAAPSPNGGLYGDVSTVIYSVPRLA
ncbi:CMRF35-like molecule 1 isoform X1 [Scophthalmus maximus]|uniref:CMRF35-like molecule 1 isoform X1 n=1 Tax=Scophthalmus maximus TaxID=52904 RepID=UPI001FA93B46|nr:CMRF35-like molecule 1 isoform X1 [Scophthalmus maximus]